VYWCLNRYVSLSHLSVLTVIVIKSGHVLEDSCFFFWFLQQCTSWSGYHSNDWVGLRVIPVYAALRTEKLNILKKQCFCRNSVRYQNLTTSVRSVVFQPWQRHAIVLLLVCCPVDNTLEVSPEIRCLDVSSRYCCYGNPAAGSKPI